MLLGKSVFKDCRNSAQFTGTIENLNSGYPDKVLEEDKNSYTFLELD